MTAPIIPEGWVQLPIEPQGVGRAGGEGAGDFGALLKRAVGDVAGAVQSRDDVIAAFLRGEAVELHQVMAAAEEASIALEVLVELRNKFQEAYRTLMSIQA